MTILKKLLLYLCRGLFGSFLLLLPTAFLLTFVFSQPAQTKRLLSQSGVYPLISQTIIKTTVNSVTSSGQTNGLPKNAVTIAAKKAFPPDDIQQKSEKTVTDAYAWLDGKKQTFSPSFDFNNSQRVFNQSLSDQAVQTIATKPICSHAQLYQLSAMAADPATILQLPCRPNNLDLNYFKKAFAQATPPTQLDITQSSGGMLPHVSGTPAKPILQSSAATHSNPQLIFSIVKNSFYILIGLLSILLLSIVALIRRLDRCLAAFAKSLGFAGILLVLYSWLLQWALAQHLLAKIVSSGQGGDIVQAAIQPFMYLSIDTSLYFGVGYVLCAGVLVIIYILTKPKPPVILNEHQTPPVI